VILAYLVRWSPPGNPSELLVQAPVRFELVINLKAAKTLGLAVPDTQFVLIDIASMARFEMSRARFVLALF
jgi:hypothetical protein